MKGEGHKDALALLAQARRIQLLQQRDADTPLAVLTLEQNGSVSLWKSPRVETKQVVLALLEAIAFGGHQVESIYEP